MESLYQSAGDPEGDRMTGILAQLRNVFFIKELEFPDTIAFNMASHSKMKVSCTDFLASLVRNCVDPKELDYSHHWQKGDGPLLTRRDETFCQLESVTSSCHKHVRGKASESYAITLVDILKEIESEVEKKSGEFR
jgi:hypothetical protein